MIFKDKYNFKIIILFVKNFYELISILPQDILNHISKFIENPFIESLKLRQKSISDFIKSKIILDLRKRGYSNLINRNTFNETLVNTCLNSINNEINDDYLIDSILLNKLVYIDNVNLDTFLKRRKTLEDFTFFYSDEESINIMLENYRYLLENPRLCNLAKLEYINCINSISGNDYN